MEFISECTTISVGAASVENCVLPGKTKRDIARKN
jgi:hypothetical protein